MKLILASTSIFRKQQLESLTSQFQAIKPGVDEEALKNPSLSPSELTQMLAKEKAKSLINDHPNAAILGGDQVAHLDGEILGKAGSPEKACEQLMKMSGQSHELITSICLVTPEQIFEHTDITSLKMKSLTEQEALEYVKQDESWTCAGSYKFEQNGHQLFESVNTQDESAIIGLPLLTLKKWLEEVL